MPLYLKIFFESNKVLKCILVIYSIILLVLLIITATLLNNLIVSSTENKNASAHYYFLSNEMKSENLNMFEKRLLDGFDSDQLKNISQKYLKYMLSINGEQFVSSPVFSTSPNISVTVSEAYDPNIESFLPKSIIKYGTILNKDDAMSLLKISTTTAKVSTELDSADNKKWIAYNFSNVKAGEIITLEVEPSLAEKMGISDNTIEIIYNGEK